MLRAVGLTKRHISKQMLPLTFAQLKQMAVILDAQGTFGLVIRCALLFGFDAFLRGSNICPESDAQFDKTRNFTRSDVVISPTHVNISIKWQKNMQTSLQPTVVQLPAHCDPLLDPVFTYQLMCALVPSHKDRPLFILPDGSTLTIYKLRQQFAILCSKIGLDPQLYSIHSLRIGGASHAHHKGAKPIDIKRHGGWQSDTFWQYIAPILGQQSTVCDALTSL